MDEAKGSNGRTGAAKKAALVSNEEMDAAMLRIVKDRSEAKRTRDFKKADAIRDELKAKGWVIEDSPKGIKLKKI